MTKELNFKNLSIHYDGEKISKSVIRKINIIEYIGVFVLILIFFVPTALTIFLIQDLEKYAALAVLIELIIGANVVYVGIFGLEKICKRFLPNHYKFITWLMEYESNEIEIGWSWDRYVINIHTGNGWRMMRLDDFINDKYILEDKADKSQRPHMVIDMINDDVKVTVINK